MKMKISIVTTIPVLLISLLVCIPIPVSGFNLGVGLASSYVMDVNTSIVAGVWYRHLKYSADGEDTYRVKDERY